MSSNNVYGSYIDMFDMKCSEEIYFVTQPVNCSIYTQGSSIKIELNLFAGNLSIENVVMNIADSKIYKYGIDVPTYQAKPVYLGNSDGNGKSGGVSLNSVVKWGGTVKGIEFYAKSGTYQFHVS